MQGFVTAKYPVWTAVCQHFGLFICYLLCEDTKEIYIHHMCVLKP